MTSQDQDLVPTTIERDGDTAIRIVWSDGAVSRWTAARLRAACPCATCREKKTETPAKTTPVAAVGLPVLSAAEARPLSIATMRPVGNYAYNIGFSDGHSAGIYPLETLRQPTQ